MLKSMTMAAVFALTGLSATGNAGQLVLVERGVSRVPIVVASNPPAQTLQAANTLAEYIEKTSGARPPVVQGTPQPLPPSAIWVGMPAEADTLFPGATLGFEHPEEILIVCNGQHLLIAGRDRKVEETQVEFGTANAVYTFLQKYLDVRWFQPWDRAGVWTDVIRRDTVALPEFVYRFHPPFRQRLFWASRGDWDLVQRLQLGSLTYNGGHAFTDWWEKYQKDHPDWFALQGSGKRSVPKWGGVDTPSAVKLCVSNPEVWAQWLKNAEAALRADPSRLTVSASPNDGGGFCVCDKCRAWDHPQGPVAGADRYVKFWNILARGLKERFPDRDVWVGAYAYSAYQDPPLAEVLEKNIAIAYVGHFPMANDEVTAKQKAAWLAWAAKASSMLYRPNLFHYSGGFLGLPTVAMRRTIRDFRFLAENNCVGLQVDSLPNSFSVQGVQYYLMAQLAYDPYQDGEALLKDYYHRAFGPAADDVEAYFDLMEKAHELIIGWEGFRHSSSRGNELVNICRQVYTAELLAKAETLMQSATAKAEAGPATYRPRVASIRKGFDFTKLQVEIMHVMKQVREARGAERQAAIEKAIALCKERDARVKAGDAKFPEKFQKRVVDTLGPPSPDMINAKQETEAHFVLAQWKPAWSDEFERTALGADWQILDGDWSVTNGQLVTTGGSLLATRKFPGLQRLEFQASITGTPGISDMSPILQSGPDGRRSGYLLQCGGYNNTRNSIIRKGSTLTQNNEFRLEPGRVYSVIAEYDGVNVRLTVDGKTVLEHADPQPPVGPANERIGFFVHEGTMKVDHVKVFTSEALNQD